MLPSEPLQEGLREQHVNKLSGQIGNYPGPNPKTSNREFVQTRLDDEAQNELYRGISTYQSTYQSKINQYNKQRGLPPASEEAIANKRYFRDRFIALVVEKSLATGDECKPGDPDIRLTNPEKATIKMKDFLGTEGELLYKLALEEEMNSEAYRNAVFQSSTKHFEGEKWAERPVVLVAGPSGSGKTTAANAAVMKSIEFLPKTGQHDNSGNDVVSVDGGVTREVSQIRKLAIQLANNKGYPGIQDLHSQSKVLDKVKENIQNAAFKSPGLGVVIPETFSGYINPLDSKRRLVNRTSALPDTRTIFCRVDGEEYDSFKETVAFMGSRRAWKTQGFDAMSELDLNAPTDTESKAYGAGGFWFGQTGSIAAQTDYMKKNHENLSMLITNDLLLVKEDPNQANGWVRAQQGKEEALLVSRRTLIKWQSESPPRPSLQEFSKHNRPPPLIRTSGELDLDVALESMHQKASRPNTTEEKRESLHRVCSILELADQNGRKINIQTAELICATKEAIKKELELFKGQKRSTTAKLLKQTIQALDKLENEARLREKSQMTVSNAMSDQSRISEGVKTTTRFRAEARTIRDQHQEEKQEKNQPAEYRGPSR